MLGTARKGAIFGGVGRIEVMSTSGVGFAMVEKAVAPCYASTGLRLRLPRAHQIQIVNTSAFVGTNPTGERITSGLLVIRENRAKGQKFRPFYHLIIYMKHLPETVGTKAGATICPVHCESPS